MIRYNAYEYRYKYTLELIYMYNILHNFWAGPSSYKKGRKYIFYPSYGGDTLHTFQVWYNTRRTTYTLAYGHYITKLGIYIFTIYMYT